MALERLKYEEERLWDRFLSNHADFKILGRELLALDGQWRACWTAGLVTYEEWQETAHRAVAMIQEL